MSRIYLSPPDVGEAEEQAVSRAIASGWVAPLGPEVDAFESELAEWTGRKHAVALSSGTAALHLALKILKVRPGDKVAVSSKTFVATANAVMYCGATPVFIDSDRETWNMCPERLRDCLSRIAIKAVVAVDLYGHLCNYAALEKVCAAHDVPLIADSAESLGAAQGDRKAGSFGTMAILSFNGNKIITTSGGGALVTNDSTFAERARFLSTQAREPVVHYEHKEVGYNYRLSNVLAALGRAQLKRLPKMMERRRKHFEEYQRVLGGSSGVSMHPIAAGERPNYWLTTLTIDPTQAKTTAAEAIAALAAKDIEARPTWKPMHLQPLYQGAEVYGGTVAKSLFETGLCLPSGSSLSDHDRARVIDCLAKLLC